MLANLRKGFLWSMSMCTSKTTQVPILGQERYLGDNVAFAHNFPRNLSEQAISKILDPSSKDIKKVQIILNKLGVSTGKAIVHFQDRHTMQDYTRRFDQDFITIDKAVQKILLKPIKKREIYPDTGSKFQVKVSNLEFSMTEQELRKIAQDFGQVRNINMEVRPNQLNKGRAIVRFLTKSQTIEFAQFADGLRIGDRVMKASVVRQKEGDEASEVREIRDPERMMAANYTLYKQHLAKEATRYEGSQ